MYVPIQDSSSMFNFIFDNGSRISAKSVDEKTYELPTSTWLKLIRSIQNNYKKKQNAIKIMLIK